MSDIETLLKASIELAALRKQVRELTEANTALRARIEYRANFDQSSDDRPALLRPQI